MTFYSGYDIANENRSALQAAHVDFMSACASADIPKIMDPREWYKIEMQYHLSSCVGNAETGPIEVAYRAANGGRIAHFSRMYAYLMSQKRSDEIQNGRYFGRDGGALIVGSEKSAKLDGCCLEKTFPYPGNYTTKIPDGCHEEAQKFKIKSSSWIGNNTGGDAFDQAKVYLGTGQGGILVGANWPFNLTSDYKLTSFRNYGGYGHAWTVLGFLDDLLVAANSHDVVYGDKGFFYITRRGWNELVANGGSSVVGLSDLTVPRPRSVDWTVESMFD